MVERFLKYFQLFLDDNVDEGTIVLNRRTSGSECCLVFA